MFAAKINVTKFNLWRLVELLRSSLKKEMAKKIARKIKAIKKKVKKIGKKSMEFKGSITVGKYTLTKR